MNIGPFLAMKMIFTGRKVVWLAAFVFGSMVLYYRAIETSVEKKKQFIKNEIVNECIRRFTLPDPSALTNPEGAAKFKESANMCKKIKINSISSHGGILLKVALRVELSNKGFIPEGRPVRYYIMKGGGNIFPFALYTIYKGNWFFMPAYEVNALLYYLRL